MESMATLEDIARSVGVSAATVSRAINGNPSIAEATRARILKTAGELGYLPVRGRRATRDLETVGKSPLSFLIEVVFESRLFLNDGYFSRIIRTVTDESSQNGIPTSVASLNDDYESIMTFAGDLGSARRGGIVFVGSIEDDKLAILQAACENLVVVDSPSDRVTSVYNDNEEGAFLAVSYLIETGCRRIGLIHGPPEHYFSRSMLAGYRRALESHGIRFESTLCAEGEFHVESGQTAMEKLLNQHTAIDAVFTNDEMGVGALKALQKQGVSIPDDVSVFGFDNLPISTQTSPTLSTVSVNYDYMARTAVRKLVEGSRDDHVVPVRIILPVELTPRESTRGRA